MAPNTSQAFPVWEAILHPRNFTSLELATLVFALLASSALLYVVAQAQERKVRRLPPGPRPWPIVGNLFKVATQLPHHALRKLAKQYGGVMYLRLGSIPCVVVSSSAAAKEMTGRLSTDASFSNRPKGLFAEMISDNYQTLMHSPHGPYWRQLRKFSSSHLFSPQRHASYLDAREQELRNMLTVLEEPADKGEAVNMKSWIFELTANILTRMLFNKRYFGTGGASQEERDEFHHVLQMVLRALGFSSIIGDFIPSLSFLAKLNGSDKQLEGLRDDTLRIVGKMMELENHRERAKERVDDDSYVPDFVDLISDAPLVEGAQPLPDRIQTLLVSELLGAGTETASTTVEWAMSEVVAHPEVIKKAQQELDAVLGPKSNGRLMQESDVANLPYLCAVVKEVFRLHPPAPLAAPRACDEAVEAWGYRIPANSRLILNLYTIHRDPDLYPNPDAFDPERFLDRPEVNQVSGFKYYELIPFGVGRRMCMGAVLGNIIVHLMLGNLLRCYDWSPPKGTTLERFRQDNLQEFFGITVYRKDTLFLLPTPREDAALST